VLVGARFYDLLGVGLYTWFMEASVLTVRYIVPVFTLTWLRLRELSPCPEGRLPDPS
jgi:hypothetical protein